jgi:diguanylate cyclase (GGDEF)-like protein/PAS domain S-box-containing protein
MAFVGRMLLDDTVTGQLAEAERTSSVTRHALAHARDFRRHLGRSEEREHANEALRESEGRLSLIYNAVSDLLFLIGVEPDGVYRFLSVNVTFLSVTSLVREEVIGRKIDEVLPLAAVSFAKERYAEAIVAGRVLRCEEVLELPGRQVVLETTLTPVSDAQGRCIYLLGASRDISDRVVMEAERERLLAQTERLLQEALVRADCDPLTDLFNHRAFHRRLDEETDRARREGTSLGVAVMDLDNFKFFNDAYGHAAGDEVLRQVSIALRTGCRVYDTLARFGGDEFALLMPGVGAVEAVAERIRSCMAGVGYRPPGHDALIPIQLSVGVAVFPEEAGGRQTAIALADTRLRRSKSGGTGAEDPVERLRASLSGPRDGFDMLCALVTAVDAKDRYTRRHSEDVMTYSVEIAQELGLDEPTQHLIRVAALLHDVGKIGVPDAILRKPGDLTDKERAAIDLHPTMGAVIVAAVPGFAETLDSIRHHHERWDGTGYPNGLRGLETPLLARLMAVADAYSAMTTDRPYRKGMGIPKALRILKDGAGSQWCPTCIAAFLRSRDHDMTNVCRETSSKS